MLSRKVRIWAEKPELLCDIIKMGNTISVLSPFCQNHKTQIEFKHVSIPEKRVNCIQNLWAVKIVCDDVIRRLIYSAHRGEELGLTG